MSMTNKEKHAYIQAVAEASYKADCAKGLEDMFVLNRIYHSIKLVCLKMVLKGHLRPSYASLTKNDWSK